MSTTRTARDLSIDSPLTLAELRTANADRTLVTKLRAMTSRERIATAALLADATGRDISAVLGLFGRLMDEAAALAAVENAQAAMANPVDTDAFYRHQAAALAALDRYETVRREARQCEQLVELLDAAQATPAQPERDDTEGLERAERELAARCACFADATEHDACLAAGRCLNLNAPQPEPGPAIPEDAQAEHCPDCDRQFWRSEMSGRCYDLLSGHEIFSCPCGHDLTPHLSNGGPLSNLDDDGPDDDSPPLLPAMARCIWRYGGTAAALRGYLLLVKRAA